MSKTILTLTLITQEDKILLGLKKRGFGMGKLNGFGGKVETEESIEEAAIREVFEECSLSLKSLEKIAVINFNWQDKKQNMEVHVFHSSQFSGQPNESEEMLPAWYAIKDIPYKKMWDDDRYWFPYFLRKEKFIADFLFDKHDKVIKHYIEKR